MRDWKPFVLSKSNLKKNMNVKIKNDNSMYFLCVNSYNQNSSTILGLFYFALYNSFDLFCCYHFSSVYDKLF